MWVNGGYNVGKMTNPFSGLDKVHGKCFLHTLQARNRQKCLLKHCFLHLLSHFFHSIPGNCRRYCIVSVWLRWNYTSQNPSFLHVIGSGPHMESRSKAAATFWSWEGWCCEGTFAVPACWHCPPHFLTGRRQKPSTLLLHILMHLLPWVLQLFTQLCI